MSSYRITLADVLKTAKTSEHRRQLVRRLQAGRLPDVVKAARLRRKAADRVADRIDGYDRDDQGESPDY